TTSLDLPPFLFIPTRPPTPPPLFPYTPLSRWGQAAARGVLKAGGNPRHEETPPIRNPFAIEHRLALTCKLAEDRRGPSRTVLRRCSGHAVAAAVTPRTVAARR